MSLDLSGNETGNKSKLTGDSLSKTSRNKAKFTKRDQDILKQRSIVPFLELCSWRVEDFDIV